LLLRERFEVEVSSRLIARIAHLSDVEPERFPGSHVMYSGRQFERCPLPEVSYRFLERICQKRASITSDPETRKALEEMARKYRDMADQIFGKWRPVWIVRKGAAPRMAAQARRMHGSNAPLRKRLR
jgi:hypothetical protein